MTTAIGESLQVSRTIRADADTLFRAWTDPKSLKHWWRMDGPGWAFQTASIDLRVGGRYRIGMTGPDGKAHVAVGEYRDVQRPVRLAFTWDWENPANQVGETLVTLEFKQTGDNATDVVLTHERFPDAARRDGHETRWTQLLTLLDVYASDAR